MTKIVLNQAYKPANEAKNRYRIIYGGSGSGKSHYVWQETLINMLSDKRLRILVVRKTAKSIRRSVFQWFVDYIAEYGLSSMFTLNITEMTITCKNGAMIVTSGLDDVERLKSIVGINRLIVEEASEIDESDFDQLDLRLRGINEVGYQFTMMFNPISELHWIKRKFFDVGMDDTFILKTTYKDNIFIDDAYKKKLEALIDQDYQFYRIYCLGDWGSIGNIIFKNWEKRDMNELIDIGTVDKPRMVPLRSTFDNWQNGVDFGYSEDPTVFLHIHADVKRKELFICDEIYETELFNDELARRIKPIVNKQEVTCDSADPRSIAELRRNDINAKGAKKGPDSIEHGIKALKQWKIYVDPSCVKTIKELSGYKMKEDRNGNVTSKPIDFDNHAMDTLRYAMEDILLEINTSWGWGKKGN